MGNALQEILWILSLIRRCLSCSLQLFHHHALLTRNKHELCTALLIFLFLFFIHFSMRLPNQLILLTSCRNEISLVIWLVTWYIN